MLILFLKFLFWYCLNNIYSIWTGHLCACVLILFCSMSTKRSFKGGEDINLESIEILLTRSELQSKHDESIDFMGPNIESIWPVREMCGPSN